MNLRGVLFLLGRLWLALAAVLLLPAGLGLVLHDGAGGRFLTAAALTGLAGAVLGHVFRQEDGFRFGRKEAFLLVSSAWVTASLVGALPYVLVKGPAFVIDAVFESASGFTTTGASILTDIEAEPASLLLWRSLTQWLGGMGIIVLGIAILPKLAVGGMQLLGAEAPGPTTEKLTPRIAQTAKALWAIYLLLTAAQSGILAVLGVPPLEAVNHALTTMATGGFSTRNASVGAFGPAVQIVIVVFMVLAGMNFALHFKILRGRLRSAVADPELRVYLWLLSVASLLVCFDLVRHGRAPLDALRAGVFQVTTMVTTTGFATEDFDAWPGFSRVLLFLLMFVGGCAGSTGGSVKVVRILIAAKKVAMDLKQMAQPNAVLPVRVGRRAIPDNVVASVMTFLILFLALFAAGGVVLGGLGLDMVTAFSASATCLGNIGPGFVGVGPAMNYAHLPLMAKLLLTGFMIVGRLELYTMLVILFLSRRLF